MIDRLLNSYYFADDPRGKGIVLVYSAHILSGSLVPDPDEVSEAGWFSINDLPIPLCGAGHDRAIDDWVNRKTAKENDGNGT